MKSIISNEKECFICKTTNNLHKHHIFGASNRSNSEQDGLWIYLCSRHHNGSDEGIHFDKGMDTAIKRVAQETWEKEYGKTTEDFIERYGRNYK